MGSITLASIKKRTVKKPPLIVIYGVAGVGKTTLALEFPGAVLMRTVGEDAPSDIDPDEFPEARSFADVIDALGVLANEDHGFGTLVLDSLEGLEELVWAETCARNGWKSIEDAGFGKGYVAADAVWSELLSGILYLRAERGMTVILIGHSEISRFDSPTTDPYSRYGVNLHKRALATMVDAADLIGFINYRMTLKKADAGFNKQVSHGEGGGARVIHVEERPGFVEKNRFGMPPTIDYKKGEGFKALSKYFPTAA